MSISPFPSQDLAKLVLGYLAEEQLMTAYDEFLQASPYLDALRNEYDRIFMTSLKSILAEYRAVKIYVDTCKPFALRRKIFQCTNLLEVVKFLVANVDLKKLQQQEAPEKASLEKQNVTTTPKATSCELCHSLSLPGCVCKSRQAEAQKPNVNYGEASSLQNSVETTPLADLPGNYVTTRKKHVKVLEKDSTLSYTVSGLQNSDSSAKQSFSSHISPEEYLARCENSPSMKSSESSLSMNSTVKAADPMKSSQNIEEFNNVLKSVVSRNKTLSGSECTKNQRISNAGTFQDFTSGVSGGESQSATYSVPDSSTSENSNIKAPTRKDDYNDNTKGPPHQLMLQVSHVNDIIEIQTCKTDKLPKLLPKTSEKQIKILSDVKVDNKLSDKIKSNKKKKPLIAINATSTPLMHMQTIMINGTPAYKHTPNTHTFTKDEIMAMPTLIVVPASGPSEIPTSDDCNSDITSNANVITEASKSPQVLGPLVIDVPPHTSITKEPIVGALPDLSEEKPVSSNLVKTVDVKNYNATTSSVPKDNIISLESSTPQVLPRLRKSSSTPRRSSHVRVLDFTTPRRILHETINEVPVPSSDPPVEIVSGSQSIGSMPITVSEAVDMKGEALVVVSEEGNNNNTGSTKENKTATKTVKQTKKYDWDADLRALVANEKPANISHRKPKPKASKKKKSIDKTSASKEPEIKKKTRKQSPRVKKKICQNVEESEDEPPPNLEKSCEIPCKPTIKIICGEQSADLPDPKTETISTKNKSNEKVDEYIETPEAERLSLQNVIGAKLNISDFLETPYKQALYDIQMGTPKFLDTDLPDVPLSNIKITDIPTPRFLSTNNPAQATPSSYSSRPTDYSSGGSYYKPDDQDYMPIPDLLPCPVTSSSSKDDINADKTAKDIEEKKSRPIRQCAKNVSYYKSSGAVKIKEVDDNVDATSSCSEPVSANSSFEFKNKKETITKTPRAKAQHSKHEARKKTSSSKKRKSLKDVVNEKPKSFMKIKPKLTPKKDTPAKNRKQAVQYTYSKGYSSVQPRKRTTSKDKLVNSASLLVPVATKSRRKSSTPRKLQCTKSFNSDSSHDTPENIANANTKDNLETSKHNTQDSDTEEIALRWSDEGSQDGKTKDSDTKPMVVESDDINKIQEFIVSTGVAKCDRRNEGTLQRDLMKRGFDSETAKIIERDLLDETPRKESTKSNTLPVEAVEAKKDDSIPEKPAETSSSNTNEMQIALEEAADDDEVAFSVHECNEESNNYFVFKHDDTKDLVPKPPIKLKDNYNMEICIEDVTVRLKTTLFSLILDQDPLTVDEIDYSYKETEQAVNSISGMDRLYTPLKDSYKSQCYEIFDSTLTSIDTPLKATSPVNNACDVSVTELVLEEETSAKNQMEANNRKRARSSSNESANSSKRTKPDADLLLKAANIQNIDIETVLTKLHGH